jgi:hypothetical protein
VKHNLRPLAWWTIAMALATVSLPSCELIPLPWMVKPVTAILASMAALLALAARPALLAELSRERHWPQRRRAGPA